MLPKQLGGICGDLEFGRDGEVVFEVFVFDGAVAEFLQEVVASVR